ncbi:MAG: YDG domain-containing protein [Treponema sp.]|nr:YDG domain-containing protein [Treponema sp.]
MENIWGLKTISFNSNGGTSIPDQKLMDGETVRQPNDPAKVNSVFIGWFDVSDNIWNFNTVPDRNMTLYAKWSGLGINLSHSNPHVFPSYEYGYALPPPPALTVTNSGTMPTGNLTVTLSGANASAFNIGGTTIIPDLVNPGDDASFNFNFNGGLGVGTYTALITITNGSNITAFLNLSYTVTRKPVEIIQVSHTKVFDGNTSASAVTVTPAGISGIISGDDVSANITAAVYTNAAIGTATMNITGAALTGADAANYILTLPANNVTVTGGGITAPQSTGFTFYLPDLTVTPPGVDIPSNLILSRGTPGGNTLNFIVSTPENYSSIRWFLGGEELTAEVSGTNGNTLTLTVTGNAPLRPYDIIGTQTITIEITTIPAAGSVFITRNINFEVTN